MEDKSKTMLKKDFIKQVKSLGDMNSSYNVLTKMDYWRLTARVEKAVSSKKKSFTQRRLLKKYNVIKEKGLLKLVTPSAPLKYFVIVEQMFDTIESAHIALGHSNQIGLKSDLLSNYANITIEMINLFVYSCEECLRSRKINSKLIIDCYSRGQVDVIDMQCQPDDSYKYIMIYKDYQTKFVVIRALHSANEVALQLTDIFCLIGAPCILDSDSGREFLNCVVEELSVVFPDLKIVRGKLCQDHVKITNQSIVKMLLAWMKDNQTSKWTLGLPFIQLMHNRAFNSVTLKSPFSALFGNEPRVGLTSFLPRDVIGKIQTEEELEKVLEGIRSEPENETSEDMDCRVKEELGSEDETTIAEIEVNSEIYNTTPSSTEMSFDVSLVKQEPDSEERTAITNC